MVAGKKQQSWSNFAKLTGSSLQTAFAASQCQGSILSGSGWNGDSPENTLVNPVDLADLLPRINLGAAALVGEFPSIVSIQSPTVPLSHCVGAIVNQNHIVTSARCVFNETNQLINPFWLRVTAGDLNIIQPSFRRFTTNVTHIFPHHQFNPVLGTSDIAVLRVSGG